MPTEPTISLRSEFPGYFRDSDETIAAAWDTHLFVFDTNILLNFFRYSENTRTDFEKVIRKIKDQVWIPHRVAYEFFRNRSTTIQSESSHYETAISDINKLTIELEKTRQHPFVSADTLHMAKECFEKLKAELVNNKNSLLNHLHDDQISIFFDEIFSGKIGEKLTFETEQEIIKTGADRYARNQPPGYLDKNKADDSAPHEAKLRRYGDLIIWLEIIRKSKADQKGIILIIDDRKEDWWVNALGRTLGPRPELVDEFKKETGQSVYLYTADRFLEFSIGKLDQKLNPGTVTEVREIRPQYNEDGIFALVEQPVFANRTRGLKASLGSRAKIKEIIQDQEEAISVLSDNIMGLQVKILLEDDQNVKKELQREFDGKSLLLDRAKRILKTYLMQLSFIEENSPDQPEE